MSPSVAFGNRTEDFAMERLTYMNTHLKAPLRRSRSDRVVGGVIAGLANYFGIDVTLARVIYIVGSIVSAAFPGMLVYLILLILIPMED
jgi:phage shock protein PspC (stress-responsive transcriptional regulator)